MDRRTLLKIMGGIAALPALGKALKSTGIKATKIAGKVLPKVSGMPEWFSPLVSKIIKEGSDISPEVKRLEDTVNIKKLKDGDTTFTLTEKPIDGEITITIDSPRNPNGQTVDLQYKKPNQDFDVETGKAINEPGEFQILETEPQFQRDNTLDLGERVTTIDKAAGDIEAAERAATGKIKNREKIKERRITKDQMENNPTDYIDKEYGPEPGFYQRFKDYGEPDFANGGIASFANGGKAKKKFLESESKNQELSAEELEEKYQQEVNDLLTSQASPGLNFNTEEGGQGGINLMYGPKTKQNNYPGFGPKIEPNINPRMDIRDPRIGISYTSDPEDRTASRFGLNVGPKGAYIGYTRNFANGGLTKTVPPAKGPDSQGVETLFRRRYS
ncbi:MAG: hypothetical protein MUO82_00755 [Candidatus Thermoplasmatota archaeon]|nr:hypothetical protein [Candidatus Thermoplasmatota archaeon]